MLQVITAKTTQEHTVASLPDVEEALKRVEISAKKVRECELRPRVLLLALVMLIVCSVRECMVRI